MTQEASVNMENDQTNISRSVKVGWGILIGVNALLVIDGFTWYFVGPKIIQTRLVAVWYMAFGVLALMVALEGYRNGSRWAWYASWVLVAALVALGLIEVQMDESPFFGLLLLGTSGITVVGLLLARKGLTMQVTK